MGEGKWAETKEAFYAAAEEAGMIIPEGLKGSKELNLVLQKELLNGWRPGDKISVTANESIKLTSVFRTKAIELIESLKKIEPKTTNDLNEISSENRGGSGKNLPTLRRFCGGRSHPTALAQTPRRNRLWN